VFEKLKYRIERLTNSEWRKVTKTLEADVQAMPPKIVDAHEHCSMHRDEVLSSELCGCFSCFQVFARSEISEWIDNGQTALCPYCPVDSVIGSASGYPITKEFLEEMHRYWF